MITDSAPGLVGDIVGEIFTRDLTKSDYSVTTSQGLSSYTFTLTPKVDIKECGISFVLYDSDGKSIYSDTVSKTSLNSGSSYVYKFDYVFFDSLSATKIPYDNWKSIVKIFYPRKIQNTNIKQGEYKMDFIEKEIIITSFMSKEQIIKELMQIYNYDFFRDEDDLHQVKDILRIRVTETSNLDEEEEDYDLEENDVLYIGIDINGYVANFSFTDSEEKEVRKFIAYKKTNK